MGDGVVLFCLGLLETLFSASNKPNLTYVEATGDYFENFGTFAKPLKIIIFHALEVPEAKNGSRSPMLPQNTGRYMGPGVTFFCLKHLEILLVVLNRANLTYMVATGDFFGNVGAFAKYMKFSKNP